MTIYKLCCSLHVFLRYNLTLANTGISKVQYQKPPDNLIVPQWKAGIIEGMS